MQGKPPIKEGQQVDVTIQSIGDKGDGIGRVNGFVVIVPETEAGKTYNVEITKVLKRCSFGKVV